MLLTNKLRKSTVFKYQILLKTIFYFINTVIFDCLVFSYRNIMYFYFSFFKYKF